MSQASLSSGEEEISEPNSSSVVEADISGDEVYYEHEKDAERNVLNSAEGQLNVPGFIDIPIFYQLDTNKIFTHGAGDLAEYNPGAPESTWEQKPRITARELAMIGLVNLITDTESWNIRVFNEDHVADMQKQALCFDLISERAWDWCLRELQDKADLLNSSGKKHTLVLDTGSCVCKSDILVSLDVRHEIQRSTAILLQDFIGEKGQKDSRSNPVNPSLYPLMRGRTSVLGEGGCVDMGEISVSFGDSVIVPIRPDAPISRWGYSTDTEDENDDDDDDDDDDDMMTKKRVCLDSQQNSSGFHVKYLLSDYKRKRRTMNPKNHTSRFRSTPTSIIYTHVDMKTYIV